MSLEIRVESIVYKEDYTELYYYFRGRVGMAGSDMSAGLK